MNIERRAGAWAIRKGAGIMEALRAYDHYFLVRYPRVWLSRFHLTILFGPLAITIAVVMAALLPLKPKDDTDVLMLAFYYMNIIVIFVEIALIGIWFAITNDNRGYVFTRTIYNGMVMYLVVFVMAFFMLVPIGAVGVLEYRFGGSFVEQLIARAGKNDSSRSQGGASGIRRR